MRFFLRVKNQHPVGYCLIGELKLSSALQGTCCKNKMIINGLVVIQHLLCARGIFTFCHHVIVC